MTAAARMGRKQEGAGTGFTSWRRSFALAQPSGMCVPPPQPPTRPQYLLVQPQAQRHPLSARLVAALGAVQVPAELGQGHAGLPVGVEHVGRGQHDEGVCHWTCVGTEGTGQAGPWWV